MAWICLAVLEESAKLLKSGSTQSLTAKGISMPSVCSYRECNQVICTKPQSGMISQLLKDQCFQASTSSSVDFPVRTSVLLEMEKAWLESEVDYSTKLSDSQKNFDRSLSSLKMCQPLESADLNRLSKSFPKWGMIVDGRVFLPKVLEPITKEKDGSFLLPTPTASTAGTNGKQKCKTTGKWINGKPSLNTMASQNRWPTPTARDWKDNGKSPSELNRNSKTLSTIAGGQLNPKWVEWLMGYPLGWTELNVSVTQWFHFKRKQRLKNSLESKREC